MRLVQPGRHGPVGRQAWFELAAGQVRLARANGTLSWLPFALDYLAENHIQAGQLSRRRPC